MSKTSNKAKNGWEKAVRAAIAGAVVVGIIALAFLWPGKTAEPRNLPVALTGSNQQQMALIKKSLDATAGDKIDVVSVASRDEAVSKIQKREVFGAIVLNMPNPEFLTASANGPAISMVMNGLVTGTQSQLAAMSAHLPPAAEKPVLKVTDVVVAHKASFDVALIALPLVFGGIIGGVLAAAVVSGRLQRVTMLAAYSLLAGTVMYLILQTWFDVIPADFWAITGAMSLGIFATSSFVAGSYALLGVSGAGLAAGITLLVANPLSGMAIPAVFLPEPWGALGQWLTIGAAGTLVRGAAYFPVVEVVTNPLIVLTIWSLLGAVAVVSVDRKALHD